MRRASPVGAVTGGIRFLSGKDVSMDEIPPTEEGFEVFKDHRCRVNFPNGSTFFGVAKSIEPDDFALFEKDDGELAVVEFGVGAEIILLEE